MTAPKSRSPLDAQRQSIERVDWRPTGFAQPDLLNERFLAPIELAGPARTIFAGPSFELPDGDWTAAVILDVTECLSENRIEVEICANEPIAAVSAKLPASGVHSCELSFVVVAAASPVNVRIRLLEGAIEGRLLVRQITFHR